MYELTKDELNRYRSDSRRSIRGFRLRKHQARLAKLNKSTASKAKAISVLVGMGMTVLHATATV
jgi:hypothetical protein